MAKNFVDNEQVVPLIRSEAFTNKADKRFALGVFSAGDIIDSQSPLSQAYLQLRAKVYIDQKGFLDESERREDGTEFDADDERSTHFIVLENKLGMSAVFACMRLIEKSHASDGPLPVETFFPEAFQTEAPINSVEVSRFMVRHDEVDAQASARQRLMVTGLAHAVRNNLGPAYAVLERPLERQLRIEGVPTERITESKEIPEYNTENFGIEIKRDIFKNRMGEEALRALEVPIGTFTYWGDVAENDLTVEEAV